MNDRQSWLWSLLFFSAFTAWGDFLPEGCQYDKECVIELPESVCADGTPSYFTVLPRKNSNNLVIYLEPGGACWNKESCSFGHVLSLTRKKHKSKWGSRKGIFNLKDKANPFQGFSIVSIPYCTGDVFMGNNEINYGTESDPLIIKHHGYKNVLLTLDAVKASYPSPEKVVLFGMSAGGMGVMAHLRNLDSAFPQSQKFALADAGTPFIPPHLDETAYQEVMNNWNAPSILPPVTSPETMRHLGDLVHYNTTHYPHIRYGLVQSYEDTVMTFFAKSVGSPEPSEAVRNTIIDVADNFIGNSSPNARVFFVENQFHLQTNQSLSKMVSAGTRLIDWLQGMFFMQESWPNVRPDLEPYSSSN